MKTITADPEPIPVFYVAGPYRARTENGVAENIAAARVVALRLWRHGYAALCPHLNSAYMGGACKEGDDIFLRGGIELLRRCDAVLLVPGWRTSPGTQDEIREAERCGIPVYRSMADLGRNRAEVFARAKRKQPARRMGRRAV